MTVEVEDATLDATITASKPTVDLLRTAVSEVNNGDSIVIVSFSGAGVTND